MMWGPVIASGCDVASFFSYHVCTNLAWWCHVACASLSQQQELLWVQCEIQKKADLLKSISDKIGTPDVDPVTMPTPVLKANKLPDEEPMPPKASSKKRRRDKGHPLGSDTPVRMKRTSKKCATTTHQHWPECRFHTARRCSSRHQVALKRGTATTVNPCTSHDLCTRTVRWKVRTALNDVDCSPYIQGWDAGKTMR